MQLRRFAIASAVAMAGLLVAAAGAPAQVLPDVQAALPVAVTEVLATPTPPVQAPALVLDPAPTPSPSHSASPTVGPQAPAVPKSYPAAAAPPVVRVPTATPRAPVAHAAAHSRAHTFTAQPPHNAVTTPQPLRRSSRHVPASDLGSGGPARSSRFTLLWPAVNREDLIGILRVLAALGALLMLSGLLARRATRYWLPG